MTKNTRPVITSAAERPRETWADPERGAVAWYTLFSGDITPTEKLTAGIAETPAGDPLNTHSHAEPELYFILEGTGTVSIDGVLTRVAPGTAIFIPGGAEHGLAADPDGDVKLLYVFPTDAFADVVYRFRDPAG